MNNIKPSTQATLLLTSSFSKYESKEEKPLSTSEWGLFASWMHEHKMKPEDLLEQGFEDKLKDWGHKNITINRINYLLQRGAALALAIEKWQRVGLWIITRADKEYPQQIKKRLKHLSPPVLYGIGNKSLLNTKTIAVVGSRDANKDNLAYAYELGKKIANDGLSLVSGGANGIDEKAMQGALDSLGNGIVILAEDLLKNSLSSKYRNYILQNNLVFISPFYPESPFSISNSIARNKYIYTISIASIIVHSNSSGGTWTGANEALKNQWVPLWVRELSDPKSPNQLLINLGANVLTLKALNSNLSALEVSNVSSNPQASLFDMGEETSNRKISESVIEVSTPEMTSFDTQLSIYDFFLYKLRHTYNDESVFKPKELEELFELKSVQIHEWLVKAEEDNRITKLDGRTKKYMLKV